MLHELKTWPTQFMDLFAGLKTCEVRINDRDFKLGDTLWLRAWDPAVNEYLGDGWELLAYITHIEKGFGLPTDLVVMSLTKVVEPKRRHRHPEYDLLPFVFGGASA